MGKIVRGNVSRGVQHVANTGQWVRGGSEQLFYRGKGQFSSCSFLHSLGWW